MQKFLEIAAQMCQKSDKRLFKYMNTLFLLEIISSHWCHQKSLTLMLLIVILRMLAFTCLYHCKMTIPTGSLIKLACICNSRSLTVIPPSTYNSDIGNPVSTSTPFIILINSHHTCNEEWWKFSYLFDRACSIKMHM